MSLGEFDLIAKYFTRPVKRAQLGIGDDCALFFPAPGMQLAVSSDMLVDGRHFLSTVAPQRLGHKALAVNLSDLAACGAAPLAFSLALALPRVDEEFLQGFSDGLFALADEHGCELIGGDTTQGPLNICITVFGEVPSGQALLRSGARAGDHLYVSGTVGDARLALEVFRGNVALERDEFEAVRKAMEQPQPRVALGQALRATASTSTVAPTPERRRMCARSPSSPSDTSMALLATPRNAWPSTTRGCGCSMACRTASKSSRSSATLPRKTSSASRASPTVPDT